MNMTSRRWMGLAAVLAAAAGLGWWHFAGQPGAPVLYGNVEIRQVDLAFNAEGRVTRMLAQEGDPVQAGELLAVLDDETYASALALAQARRDAAKAQLDLLLAGSRQEDIDHAKAERAAGQADLTHAQTSFSRQAALVGRGATTVQSLDDARLQLDSAQAGVAAAQATLTALINGPRPQEIQAARALYDEAGAQLALAQTELNNTKLYAPVNGIMMTRVIEPGTVVLPSDIVYSMANTAQVWVRAFVPETMLGLVAPGTAVTLNGDTPDAKTYHGRVGYVSPVAEFTPKTVETPELRTQLVYRLRIRVTDADAGLRQGMPLSITLPAGH